LPWIDGLDASRRNILQQQESRYTVLTWLTYLKSQSKRTSKFAKGIREWANGNDIRNRTWNYRWWEEDGVDNSDVDSSKLYTQPDEVAYAYEELSKINPRFTIEAAAFGNVHGVYKPGNVKQNLKKLSGFVQKKFNTGHNPVDFVFHGSVY
jgi:fructose-bisphosphate aldolase class II